MMTSDFETVLDEIRIELNESVKGLKKENAVTAINDSGRKIAAEYGISIVKSAPGSSSVDSMAL